MSIRKKVKKMLRAGKSPDAVITKKLGGADAVADLREELVKAELDGIETALIEGTELTGGQMKRACRMGINLSEARHLVEGEISDLLNVGKGVPEVLRHNASILDADLSEAKRLITGIIAKMTRNGKGVGYALRSHANWLWIDMAQVVVDTQRRWTVTERKNWLRYDANQFAKANGIDSPETYVSKSALYVAVIQKKKADAEALAKAQRLHEEENLRKARNLWAVFTDIRRCHPNSSFSKLRGIARRFVGNDYRSFETTEEFYWNLRSNIAFEVDEARVFNLQFQAMYDRWANPLRAQINEIANLRRYEHNALATEMGLHRPHRWEDVHELVECTIKSARTLGVIDNNTMQVLLDTLNGVYSEAC